MSSYQWLTPDSLPDALACRSVQLPDTYEWLGIFAGLFLDLMDADNWQAFGSVTPEEAAAAFEAAFDRMNADAMTKQCSPNAPAPYWENEGDVEDESSVTSQSWYGIVTSEVWYEQLSDWVIAGFLAITFTPTAAIQYLTFVPALRLAFRRHDLGGIVRILIDGLEQTTVDTYSATPDIVTVDVNVPSGMGAMDSPPHTLWVMMSTDVNPAVVGDPSIQVVRKYIVPEEAMFQLRQNPDDSCQLQQSVDGGTTWTLAFDYALCIPPATQTILDTVINNNSYTNPYSPTVTYISQNGYTDAQKQAALNGLCYACQALVASMADTAYQVATNQITTQNEAAGAALIAAGVLLIFDIMTFGALTPLCLAITGAALALYTAITSVDPAIFNDTTNREVITCLAQANLANQTVSLASFQTAFTGADCLTTDQQAIAAIFTSMLQNLPTADQLYAYFIQSAGDSNAAAQGGLITVDCGCIGTWCYDITPDTMVGWQWWHNGYFPCSTLYTGQPDGNVQTVSGAHVWHMNTASFVGITFQIYLPTGCTLTEVLGYYDVGTYPSDNNGKRLEVNTTTFCATSFASNPIGSSGLSLSGGQTVTINFSMLNNSGGSNKTGLLSKVRIGGTGVKPFGYCPTC